MFESEAELEKSAQAVNKTYSSSEMSFGRGIRYPLSNKEATSLGLTPGYGESPKKEIMSLYRSKRETSTRDKNENVCIYQW